MCHWAQIINPDSLEHSNEEDERSQDESVSILSLGADSVTIIDPDSPDHSDEKNTVDKKRHLGRT